MKIIEFVGPSGIGKSTFLQHLVNERGDASWITRDEGLNLIAKKRSPITEKIIIKLARLIGVSLTSGKKEDYLKKIKEYDHHCSLLFDLFLDSLQNSNLAAWQKITLFNYYIQTVLYTNNVLLELPDNRTIVSDEGIIHNGGITSLLNNYEKYKGITDSDLFPKAVIFCDLNMDHYRERLKSRFIKKSERKIHPFMVDVTDKELEAYMIRVKENNRKKLEACKMLDIPILEIEPVSVRSNISKAMNFINQISRKV